MRILSARKILFAGREDAMRGGSGTVPAADS